MNASSSRRQSGPQRDKGGADFLRIWSGRKIYPRVATVLDEGYPMLLRMADPSCSLWINQYISLMVKGWLKLRISSIPADRFTDPISELPPELLDQCQALLRKNLWPFSPVHWPTFQKQLASGTVEKSLYYAMLASAARTSPALIARFGSEQAASVFFADKVRKQVQDNLDSPSLADAHALLLIVLIDWGSSHATRAFMYLGLAARIALTFLHEADHRLNHNFLIAEIARRTIWMTFMVEQFLCSGNGRIPAIRAQELHISLPCPEMDYTFAIPSVVPMFDGALPPYTPSADSKVGSVGELGFLVQISRIWNLVATCTFKYSEGMAAQLRQLENSLFDWRTSLPAQYQDQANHLELHVDMGTGLSFGFAHCVYHCAMVFVQRERLHDQPQQSHGSSSAEAVRDRDNAIETIFCSANRIIEILNALEGSVSEGDMIIFPLFMLYSCFTASSAIAYISIKRLTSLRPASLSIVRESLRILRNMRSSWSLVVEWHEKLSRLVRVLQDRAMGIEDAAAADTSFERLPYGHLRASTPVTPIGAPAASMMGALQQPDNITAAEDLNQDHSSSTMFGQDEHQFWPWGYR